MNDNASQEIPFEQYQMDGQATIASEVKLMRKLLDKFLRKQEHCTPRFIKTNHRCQNWLCDNYADRHYCSRHFKERIIDVHIGLVTDILTFFKGYTDTDPIEHLEKLLKELQNARQS